MTERTVVTTDKAPKAVGPYSAAIRAGEFVFVSGNLGLDPASGEFDSGGVEAQTRRALQNLQAILGASGSAMDSVVKTTVFLQDMGDFGKMNAVYAEFFPAEPPARSAVEVAALPKGGLVEIEAIALVKS
ncbi:MAG: RidA family protein [Anaerolineales bacterium]|nr:RidA family protein [Anaerolineales bacterium]